MTAKNCVVMLGVLACQRLQQKNQRNLFLSQKSLFLIIYEERRKKNILKTPHKQWINARK